MAVLMLFCALPLGSFASDVKIPEDAVEFNGNYYKVYEENKKWTEAEAWCEEQGGHLVTITSAEEQAFIERIITGDKTNIYWIGLRLDTVPQAWVTNESLSYTNWSENNPDHRVDGEVYVNIYGKDHIVYGKTWQKKGQWNDLTDSATSGEGTDVDFYQLSKTGFICEWEKSTPVGYDFYKDSYNFTNENWYISEKYFTTLYEPAVGKLLYRNRGGYSNGCCFGMTYTTALFYNSKPDATSIVVKPRISQDTCSNLRDALSLSEVNIAGKNISVLDYIKYMHLYEYSAIWQDTILSTKNDIRGLLNCVKSALADNSINVGICFSSNNGNGEHEVLAVGYDGKDILIDDPNEKTLCKLIVNPDFSWQFGCYSSNDSDLYYSTDIEIPYTALTSGTTVSVSKCFVDYEKYIENAKRLNSLNNLVSCKKDSFKTDLKNMNRISVIPDMANNGKDYEENELYWVNESESCNDIECTNDGTISIAGNNTMLNVSATKGSEVSFVNNSEDVQSTIKSIKGDEYAVSLENYEENDTYELITHNLVVNGTANGNIIEVKKTDTGVVVSGLNNITIKYIKDDVEISDAKADVPDGREVNISVDEKSGNIETDFKTESSAEDQTENACPFCGKVHGKGFIERVIAFFHMIFAFFKKLFHR